MKDWLLEHPKLLIGSVIVVVLLPFIIPRDRPSFDEDWDEEMRKEAGLPAEQAPDSDRVKEVRRLSRQDATVALAAAEAILAQPENQSEQAAAEELVPELLEKLYNQHVRADAFDEARQVRARMQGEYPAHTRTKRVHRNWGQVLSNRIAAGVKSGDAAIVESLFTEYATGVFYQPRRDTDRPLDGDDDTLRAYAEFQMKRWIALPSAQRLQPEGRRLAADSFGMLLNHNDSARLGRLLRDAPTVHGEALMAFGQFFEGKHFPVHELNALSWANDILMRGGPWRAGDTKELARPTRDAMQNQNEARMSLLANLIARTVQENPDAVFTALRSESFLDDVIRRFNTAEHRTPLLRTRLEFAIADYMEATDSLKSYDLMPLANGTASRETRAALNKLLHIAKGTSHTITTKLHLNLFDSLVRDGSARLWDEVSPEVVRRIDAEMRSGLRPEQREQERRQALSRLVRAGETPIPIGLPAIFHQRRIQVATVDGVYGLGNRTSEALGDLRSVMLESGDARLIDQVREAVEGAFRSSRREEKFDRLIELAGFYAAEFAENLGAGEFGAEFRAAMISSASAFQNREPMKYVFVQALMAEIFPNEELGRQAKLELIPSAFDVVQGRKVETQFDGVKLPSSLEGVSTVAVENSTDHHILMVYDGPERFGVLCDPKKKGSFTLQNGAYRIAVMTPLGDIQPYRAERTFQNEHAPAIYRVESADTKSNEYQFSGYSDARGDYTLLRTSAAAGPVRVDGETGVISRGR